MSFVFRHRARVVFPLVGVLSGLGGCAYVTPEQPRAPALPALAKPAPFTAADAEFVQALNTMDQTQIALAKSATTQSGRSDIALLGATIAKDLSAVQARLATLATAHTLSLTDTLSPVEHKRVAWVQNARGAVFDRRYIRYFASAHARIKPVLARQIATGSDPAVVAIARDVQTRLADYQAALR